MNYSAEEMARFRELYERSRAISKEKRMRSVEQLSPYSHKINVFIRNTKEFNINPRTVAAYFYDYQKIMRQEQARAQELTDEAV